MSKVTTPASAVRASVFPVATLVFAFTDNRSHAAAFEAARQFHDRKCRKLAATGLLQHASIPVAVGAVERLERAFAGGVHPAPAPSRHLQIARDGRADNGPDWTNVTMTMRLMAGAMGYAAFGGPFDASGRFSVYGGVGLSSPAESGPAIDEARQPIRLDGLRL